jgi:hypothetical protein
MFFLIKLAFLVEALFLKGLIDLLLLILTLATFHLLNLKLVAICQYPPISGSFDTIS